MKRIAKVSLLMAAIFTLASCSYRTLDFTVISSKTIQMSIDKSLGKTVEGKSMGFLGLGSSLKGTVDAALESAGPEYDLLIDGVVFTNDYFFVAGYKVKGTAINTAKLRAQMGDEKFSEWLAAHNTQIVTEDGSEVSLAN